MRDPSLLALAFPDSDFYPAPGPVLHDAEVGFARHGLRLQVQGRRVYESICSQHLDELHEGENHGYRALLVIIFREEPTLPEPPVPPVLQVETCLTGVSAVGACPNV